MITRVLTNTERQRWPHNIANSNVPDLVMKTVL